MPRTKDSITNWIKSSNYDIKTAEYMLATGRYIYVLFMCHLSVEKLLKALYEAVLGKVPPRTHNLIYLANAVNLKVPEDHLKLLESLNDLSIVAMATPSYLNKIARPGELSPSLAMGVTAEHLAGVAIPVVGGMLWVTYGYRLAFLVGALVAVICFLTVARLPRLTPSPAPDA